MHVNAGSYMDFNVITDLIILHAQMQTSNKQWFQIITQSL